MSVLLRGLSDIGPRFGAESRAGAMMRSRAAEGAWGRWLAPARVIAGFGAEAGLKGGKPGKAEPFLTPARIARAKVLQA